MPDTPASMPDPGSALAGWTSTPQVLQDLLVPGPAAGLAGLFELDSIPEGDVLPPMWHWVYFLPRPKRSETDVDGHPVRGTSCRRSSCHSACLPVAAPSS
jgi:3-methylfumaryl-CoA hydratase